MAERNATTRQRTTADEVREKIQLTKSKQQFNNKMGDIWKLIIDMRQKNGDQDINENNLYRVLCSYYEMGLKMQEAIEAMTAIQTALQCVTSAIGVMDDIIGIFNGSLQSIYQNDQGFFARFKARRQVKKAQKSIVNRMNMITSYMTGMSRMADDITASMDGAFRRMNSGTTKRKKKTSGSDDGGNNFPRTEKLIDEYMKSNGMDTGTGSGSGSGAGANGGAGGGDGWDAN